MKSFLHIVTTAIYIVIFSVVAAVVFNFLRSDTFSYDPSDYRPPAIFQEGIAAEKDLDELASDHLSSTASCEPIPVFLDDAYEDFFLTGKAIFVDTRLEKDFKDGHIKGAVNIPLDMTVRAYNRIQNDLPKDMIYVFYCDEGCDSSESTAHFFCHRGYEDGKVFTALDSFEHWFEMGYPTEK